MSHRFVSWFCMATFDPMLISGRDLALLLYDISTFSLVVWACWSALDVWHCHSSENAHLWAGSVSCIGCPYYFWAWERPSLQNGVFWCCSNALVNLFSSRYLPCHADLMIFFMDLTVASALPLLGDTVMMRWHVQSPIVLQTLERPGMSIVDLGQSIPCLGPLCDKRMTLRTT